MRLFSFGVSKRKRLARFFKHPVVITLIASALIPGIVGISNARALRARARIDQALEIINASSSVNAILNKMKTEFESFEKDSLGGSPDDYRKRREELRVQIHSLHREFDGIAWWWPSTISFRVKALNLISESKFKDLQSRADEYIQNLKDTSELFAKPRSNYLPASAPPREPMEAVMPGLDARFKALQFDRDELVGKMAALVMEN